MATPAIASLAASFPGVGLDVMTGAWTRPAFAGSPNVHRVLDSEMMLGGRRPDPATMARVVRRLGGGGYDAAIVLETGLWLALLPWLAGIPVRSGLDSGGRGMTHSRAVAVVGVRHEAERYLDCARAIGADRIVRRMTFRPGEAGEAEADAALRAAGWAGEELAVLHPGGGANPGMRLESKRWPVERFGALARRIAERGPRPVVVCGRGEEPLGAELAAAVPFAIGIGARLSLAGLGALAARAALYVGNDSGPTHVAAAVGAPTLAIFGPSDERRYGPFGEWPDGTPIGDAVAEPRLAPDDPAAPFLSRSVANVSVDAAAAVAERVMERGARWRGGGAGAERRG